MKAKDLYLEEKSNQTLKGKLFLIPAPLGDSAGFTIPAYVVDRLHRLDYFIAERARTARAFIKSTHPAKSFSELTFFELNKFTVEDDLPLFLDPTEQGHDVGLLSEAGCPGVADPGAAIVALAHERGIGVVPLVGPSSLLLALMASGLNGQSFCFHGYLPVKKPDLAKALKKLEQAAQRLGQTQLLIETPYRNNNVLAEAVKILSPPTKLCIAADLTFSSQYIATKTVGQWRKTKLPDLHKRPAVFLIG